MTSSFDLAVAYVLRKEGLLADNKADPGGITMRGISLRLLQSLDQDTLKGCGIEFPVDRQTIIALSEDQAKSVYKTVFWDHTRFDKIISQNNCNYIFDMAVNMGIAPAIKCAQRATWAVTHQYRVIVDDGILGNDTLALINQCGIYLLPAMCSERAGFYRLIAHENPSNKEFIEGWLRRAYYIGG